MAGPLDGIRILDLTTIYSGPICTSILGDQGADVIKVESPEGDYMRAGRLFLHNGVHGAFAMMNRNKRSIVLDLKLQDGRAAFLRLVRDADVVVENYRPGVMERLDIDYDVLREINPRIIFASITGVGRTGPMAHRRVYDAIVQSISGMGSLQADPTTGRPVLVNTLVCDKVTSMSAAQAITAAIVARERAGVGQRLDISMLDSALFFLWPDSMLNFTFVGDYFPYTFRHTHAPMVRETADGYICTMPVQLEEWAGIFRSLDLPNLVEDESYHTEDGINMEKLHATLNEAFLHFTTDEIAARMEKEHVPFSHINARPDVIEDPQVVAQESIWEFEHPIAGPMRQARPPGRFSETPAEIFRCSPELGEHTWEVLAEAGYTDDEIADLYARRVTG